MDYKVVNGYDAVLRRQSPDALAARVYQEMNQGWWPQGGVAAYVRENGETVFLQAMVRIEPGR